MVKFPMENNRRFRNSVGPQIRKQRIGQALSQDQLATKLQLAGLSLDRAGVAKIEARIRSVFDYELAIIARVLGRTADDLFPPTKHLEEQLPALLEGSIRKPQKKADMRARDLK